MPRTSTASTSVTPRTRKTTGPTSTTTPVGQHSASKLRRTSQRQSLVRRRERARLGRRDRRPSRRRPSVRRSVRLSAMLGYNKDDDGDGDCWRYSTKNVNSTFGVDHRAARRGDDAMLPPNSRNFVCDVRMTYGSIGHRATGGETAETEVLTGGVDRL